MSAILYPVAANAEQALAAPLGRAEREREALAAAKAAVAFTTDATGPAFATREAAEAAYRAPLGEGFARVAEQILPGQTLKPVEPVYAEGRRWPAPSRAPPRTAWRLMVSYWRIATAERPIAAPQARKARRAGLPFTPDTLRAMARAPLQPVEPQQPLDIGLFETRLPEAPHRVVPDE
ncbi:MAG TPA: hypothetical protein VGC92_12135 [Phenylobacterium sp.]